MHTKKNNFFLSCILLILIQFSCAQTDSKTLLFVGSYTDGIKGDGIHVYSFNPTNGNLQEIYRESDLVNASYLSVSHNGKYLYSATESKLEEHGNVSAFAIDSTSGKLTFLNKQTTRGRNPAYISIHESDRFVVSSNYTDAVVNIYECNADGSLKPSGQHIEFRGSSIISPGQDMARAHSTIFSPDNEYLYVMDLGSDKIHALQFNSEGTPKLVAEEGKTYTSVAGSGPRHFAFHPKGKYGYCINELDGTITSFAYDKGNLNPFGVDFSYIDKRENYKSADIQISNDGKFLYASNREENSVAIFHINIQNGRLELVGHESVYGDHPRSLVIDPSDGYLLVSNQISGNVVIFKRNKKTGKLTKLKDELQLKAPAILKMRTYKNH